MARKDKIKRVAPKKEKYKKFHQDKDERIKRMQLDDDKQVDPYLIKENEYRITRFLKYRVRNKERK